MSGDEKVKQEAKRESKVQSCLKTASSLSAQGSLRICGSKDLPSPLLGPGGTQRLEAGHHQPAGDHGQATRLYNLWQSHEFPQSSTIH